MKSILVEHKQKLRQDQRDLRNKSNFKTFTPPNQGINDGPNFFVQGDVESRKRQRTGSDPEIQSVPNQPLLISGNEDSGPKGPELETQTQIEEFAV